jgi:hypothetical protein
MQVLRRHGAEEGDLQQQVNDGAQDDGTKNGKRYTAPRIARLAREVHGTLKAVVAEYDTAGRHRGEDRGRVGGVAAAVYADAKILPMETLAHQRDRGRGRNDQFEERDRAIGARKNLDAPKIQQEVDDDQRPGDAKTRDRELALAIGGVHIQILRPAPRPGTHILHRCLGFHGYDRDHGDPRSPAGDEADQGAVGVKSVADRPAGFREHRAELGKRQGDEQYDYRADQPGPDGARTGQLRRAPCAE